MYGWLIPKYSRYSSNSCVVAVSPNIITAGSPGVKYSNVKTKNATQTMIGIVRIRRFTIYFVIDGQSPILFYRKALSHKSTFLSKHF
jgi:hypothetical protein